MNKKNMGPWKHSEGKMETFLEAAKEVETTFGAQEEGKMTFDSADIKNAEMFLSNLPQGTRALLDQLE